MPKQAKRPTRREKVAKTNSEKVVHLKPAVQPAKIEEVPLMPEATAKPEVEAEAPKAEPEAKGFFARNKWIITSIGIVTAIAAGIAYAILSDDSSSSSSDTTGDQV